VARIADMGHDASRFEPVGYGARRPVLVSGAPDDDASRRVEFLVVAVTDAKG